MSNVIETSVGFGRDERLDYIIQNANRGRFVSLRDLTERFGVNVQTARRDVALLAEKRLVTKVHGGAVAVEDPGMLSVAERFGVQETEKRRIGQAAASFIEDGDVIFLDGGSTTAYLAQYLLDRHIHVVTNSVSLIATLRRGWPNVELIVTGGYYHPKSELLLGPQSVQTIRSAHVNKAFLSAAGVTADGVFNANVLVVEMEQAVISRASETYLLADSSKLERTSLIRVCGLEDVTSLVTTGSIPKAIASAAKAAGCRIHDCSATS